MKRMSEHTGLISSYQLLITAACTNTGGKMKGSYSRAADRCPFVPRHSLSQVTSFMQLGMLWWNGPLVLWCHLTSPSTNFDEVNLKFAALVHITPWKWMNPFMPSFRIGGREKYYHCDRCDMCLLESMRGEHTVSQWTTGITVKPPVAPNFKV